MSYGWLDDDTWRCFVPATPIVKSGKQGADKTGKRWIQGIASTSARDLQGEIVDQNGIDLSYFLKYGWFNNDHKDGPENKIGIPTEAKVTKDGLWVKGYLLKDKKIADDFWELMNSLERSGTDRRVGFSIQGKVKRREGKVIKECWIQEIAITTAPVNTTTWAEIVKSLSAKSKPQGEEPEEKALDTAGSGQILIPESLDKEQKEEIAKSYTFDETVTYLVDRYGFDKEVAKGAATVVFHLYGRSRQ